MLMSKNFSLYHIYISIEKERKKAEKTAEDILNNNKIKTAVFLQNKYDLPVKQGLQMLYFIEYKAKLEIVLLLYKHKGIYYLKKPTLWKRIFKKYDNVKIKIAEDNIYIDNKLICFDDAKEIFIYS